MRSLTPQEEAKLVSKDELESMRTGITIAVKWPNGEGPYTYTLKYKSGLPFAVDNWGKDHLISFVGFDDQHERIIAPRF